MSSKVITVVRIKPKKTLHICISMWNLGNNIYYIGTWDLGLGGLWA